MDVLKRILLSIGDSLVNPPKAYPHPDTLASLTNLAESRLQEGELADAEAMHWQMLRLQETVLGSNQPDTPRSMRRQGKCVDAEQMHRQTLLELGQKGPGLPCRYCKDFSIRSLREKDYQHQPSLKALKQSVDNGCRFCRFLWESFDDRVILDRLILDSEGNAPVEIRRYQENNFCKWAPDSIEVHCGHWDSQEKAKGSLTLVTEEGRYYADFYGNDSEVGRQSSLSLYQGADSRS